MAKKPTTDVLAARREAALLLDLDPAHLSRADVLRCDQVATLRVTVDHASTEIAAGRATTAVFALFVSASDQLTKLVGSHKFTPPEARRSDPKEALLRQYFLMRSRAGISEHGTLVDSWRSLAIELAEQAEQVEAARAAPGT
jgi:hypothetical protein